MHTSTGAKDIVVPLVPGGDAGLAHLSDRELLTKTRELVGRSNQVFAALLAHLAEVDARGLHRTRACASLYTYCIYELRLSEDAAARRAGAAKLVKRFPLLLDAIAHGELHLTGLLMLGPHLTPDNIVEVLGRAKFRTKKELARLIRELHPLPLVPDLVEPLRPEPRPLRRPTSEEYAASLAPAVRELPPGERPKDWANDANDASDASDASDVNESSSSSAGSELTAPARLWRFWSVHGHFYPRQRGQNCCGQSCRPSRGHSNTKCSSARRRSTSDLSSAQRRCSLEARPGNRSVSCTWKRCGCWSPRSRSRNSPWSKANATASASLQRSRSKGARRGTIRGSIARRTGTFRRRCAEPSTSVTAHVVRMSTSAAYAAKKQRTWSCTIDSHSASEAGTPSPT